MSVTSIFVRPRTVGGLSLVTGLVAFAVVSAVAVVVANGVGAYLVVASSGESLYFVIALLGSALLVVPAVTVVESAVTFTERQRDDRLATLRLLGADARVIRRIAAVECAALASIGSAVGVLVGGVASVMLGAITIRGGTLGGTGAHAGPVFALVVVAGITLVAVRRGSRRQRAVLVDPLAVRTRPTPEFADPRKLRRDGIALGVVVAVNLVIGWLPNPVGVLLAAVGIVLGMSVVRRAGPVVVAGFARRWTARTDSVVGLVAARGALESPFATWRRVSGVAMTTFVAVVAGAGMSLLAPESDPVIVHDVTVSVALVLGCAFVLAACSVAVDEVGAVIDRRALYVSLDRVGMPPSTVDRIRFATIAAPLGCMSIGSAAIATMLVGPISLAVGGASAGVALVLGGAAVFAVAAPALGIGVTRRLVRRQK